MSTTVQYSSQEHQNPEKSSPLSSHLTATRPTIPQVALPIHDAMISQVAKKTGGMGRKNSPEISTEEPRSYVGMKRRRNDETCDSIIHPFKVARGDTNDQKLSHHTSYSPEAQTRYSHLPHMRHSDLHNTSHHSHQESMHIPSTNLKLNKFTIVSWANQLCSAAYLRDMGKSSGKVYNNLVGLLSTIKTQQDHPELTLRMLMETKLAMQIRRFVDHTSSSPESVLANEIDGHWQNIFGENLKL